jgi:hypothetical protein
VLVHWAFKMQAFIVGKAHSSTSTHNPLDSAYPDWHVGALVGATTGAAAEGESSFTGDMAGAVKGERIGVEGGAGSG